MRPIKHIVVHHTVTPRDQDLETAMKSFDRTHKERLTSIGQPESSGKWKHIAYHYVIDSEGNVATARELDFYGYHASNWEINRESVGIALLGDFDNEQPTPEQLASLKRTVDMLKGRFEIESVTGHRHWTNTKSCPGVNFTDSMISELMKQELSEWQRNAIRWAKKNRISNGERPLEGISRVEVMEMLRKFDQYLSQ